jgi:hypothetical protein
MSDENDQISVPAPVREIDVFYRKAEDHRTVHSDGAWAGLSPQLDIQISFFSELQPMPSKIRHKLLGNSLGPEVKRDVEIGILRESIVTVLMNPIIAIQTIRLLQQMVEKVREILPPELQQDLDKALASPISENVNPNVSGT